MSKTVLKWRMLGSVALPFAFATVVGLAPIAHAAQPASYQRAQTALAHGKLQDARLDLLNTIRRHPNDGAAHAMLGAVNLQLGNAVSAERQARKAIAAHYHPNRSLALLLKTYIAQGRAIDLLHDFPIGTATGARGAVIALGRVRANLILSRPDQAKADLAQAAQFAPNSLDVAYGRIDLALAQHDVAQAQTLIIATAKSAAGAPKLLRREAQLDIAQDKPAAAATVAKQAIAKDPSNIKGKLLLAQALLANEKLPQAQAALNVATALVPNSIGAADMQATIDVEEHHWHRANGLLQHIAGAEKQIPSILYLRAMTFAAIGQPVAALTNAQSFAAKLPNDPSGQMLLAVLALQNRHYHLARDALARLKTIGPLDAHALDLSAAVDIQQQKWRSAERAAHQALKLDPKDPTAWRSLGEINQQKGAFAKAEQDFQTAINFAPAATHMRLPLEHQLATAAILAGDRPVATKAIAALDRLGGATAAAPLEAQLALLHGNIGAARVAFKRLLAAKPGSVSAQFGLARIDLLTQHPHAALAKLTALDKHDPANPQVVLALAGLQHALNQPDAALAVLERAHHHAPDNIAFVVAILRQQRAAKQYKAAEGLLSTLPASLQSAPPILLQRAKLELAQGQLDAAALSMSALLNVKPDDVNSRLALTRIDMARKNPRAAQSVIKAGLARDPHQLALLEAQVGLAFAQKGLAAAEQQASALAANPIHMPEASLLAGQLALSQHQWTAAATAFDRAYEKNPSPVLAMTAVRADLLAGQHNAANQMLQAATVKFPNNGPLSDMRGSVAIDQGKLASAAQIYTHSLTIAPQDDVALDNLAWLDGKLGKPQARALAERAYISAPQPQTADTLGWILLRPGASDADRARALALLNLAHQGDPTNPDIAYHDAAALAETGAGAASANRARDKQAAIAILQPLIKAGKPFTDRSAATALLTRLQPKD